MSDVTPREKRCSRCKTDKRAEQFSRSSASKDRMAAWCKSCESDYGRERRKMRPPAEHDVSVTEKRCANCNELKPASEFTRRKASSDGLHARCTDCIKATRSARNFTPDPAMLEKLCPKCDVVKPVEEFHRRKVNADGLYHHCKDCAWKQTNEYDLDPELIEKLCEKCGATKPVTEFWRDKARRDGLNARCKDCAKAKQQSWDQQNPGKKESYARRFLLKRYSLTEDDWDERLTAQGGTCPCGRPATCVDHDHDCCPPQQSCGDCVRGLLCEPCNLGIGMLQDDSDRLIILADYLRAWQSEKAPVI